ncbi:MAG: HupE/UreJ family protein, partial [Pseudomonadota bacterium]|nr:HupE/UreJ family protein [Pseudomonadota bacterium]
MIKFITLFIFAAFSVFTHSHELSNGYLTLKNDSNNTLSGELLLKPEDIGQAAGLDSNNDGNLTWGEVNRNHTMANDYIQNHLVIRGSETRCTVSIAPPSIRDISAESLLVYPLSVNCVYVNEVSIQYTGIVSDFPTHKLLTTVTLNDHTSVYVLSDERSHVTISATGNSWTSQFGEMVYQGIWHVFIGLDHILFLVATVLTVNLYRENKRWVKEQSKRHI